MKKRFVDLSMGPIIRKIGIGLATFVITFGVVSSIRNAGDTYASIESSIAYKVTWNGNANNAKVLTRLPDEGESCKPEYASYKEEYDGCYAKDLDENYTNKYNILEVSESSNIEFKYKIAEREGYIFKGWCQSEPDCENPSKTGSLTIQGNTTFYAKWTEKPVISFKPEGGTIKYDNKTYTEDFAIEGSNEEGILIMPSDCKKDGYVFGAWEPIQGSGSGHYNAGDELYYTRSRTFKAVWMPNIKFELDGGTVKYNNELKTSNFTTNATYSEIQTFKIILPSECTKNGYVFAGWKASTSNDVYQSEEHIFVQVPTTYTAIWTLDSNSSDTPSTGGNSSTEVTISLDKNGGTGNIDNTKSCTISTGKTICKISDLPTTLEREGYEFKGWGTSKYCTNGNTTINVSVSDKGKTYYACWEEVDDSVDNPAEPNDGTTSDKEEDSDNENKVENPGTGSWLLYIVYLVGTLALGYTGYYTYKTIKIKND